MHARAYALVTSAYWGFTLTDGALRMLVLLHFHDRGLTVIQLAYLFLLYEFCGILTNLFGGWLASSKGLKITLTSGLFLQILSLVLLSLLNPVWSLVLTIAYIMGTQALSGIAKDLTKMSSKSAVRVLVPTDTAEAQSGLFKWVAILTGSKNALKGIGFFLGGLLLTTLGFQWALWSMAIALSVILIILKFSLKGDLGRSKQKAKFRDLFSKTREINILSAARFFLFASRDVWFVVGLPVFLSSVFNWSHSATGAFMAAWMIGYGIVQASAPKLLRKKETVSQTAHSALISYLILAYSDADKAALNVGFYYMANAGGRLIGTLLSGLTYAWAGLAACLWVSSGCVLIAVILTIALPRK